jgi:hypothetical protein
MRSSQHGNATYSRYIRHNFLYTCGKIGLTLCLLLSPLFDVPNEVGKLQQIHYTEGGATGGKDHTGIRRSKAGPSSRQYPHVISSLVEADPIFSPTVAVVKDLKLLTVQGMKGMSDRENPFC